MRKVDVVFINVPVIDTDSPLQAPAILKAEVQNKGYTATTFDFNLEHRKLIKKNEHKYNKVKNFLTFSNNIDADTYEITKKFIEECVQKMFSLYKFKYVGISVFAYTCQRAAELFSLAIKDIDNSVNVFLGGQGLGTMGIQANKNFAEELKRKKIINGYISSEGEISTIEYLKNNLDAPGVNKDFWIQEKNIGEFAYPDYEDYNLDEYGVKSLIITGSRGCVRRCTFCDIHKHWKNYVFRDGKDICEEMIHQYEKYKINRFQFSDSLVNGSMKAYRDFITNLAMYNQNNPDKKITWTGQFIVRGLTQMTDIDWKHTKESGADVLYVGVESGSEKIRDHMQKKFSNKDLDDFVAQAHKHKVKLAFMMLVGYPTETEEDFYENIKMFERYAKYKIIQTVLLGTTLGMLPGTPLVEHFENDLLLNHGENFWIYKKNPNLDFKERIKRRIILGERCEEMGYDVKRNMENIKFLNFLWNIYKNNQKQNLVDIFVDDMHDQKYS